jgi:hypothetical protein
MRNGNTFIDLNTSVANIAAVVWERGRFPMNLGYVAAISAALISLKPVDAATVTYTALTILL